MTTNTTAVSTTGTSNAQIQTPHPVTILFGAAACLALAVGLIVVIIEETVTPHTWQWMAGTFALPFAVVGAALLTYVVRWGWRTGLHRFETDTRTDLDGGGVGASPEPQVEKLLPINLPLPEARMQLAGEERSYGKNDLRHLVNLVWTSQPAARSLTGHKLPSGEVLASYQDDVQPFFRLLVRFRLISNFDERQKYVLSATGEEAWDRLRLR